MPRPSTSASLIVLLVSLGLGLLAAAPVPRASEPPFHAGLRKVAAEYRTYGRIDDEMRWSPFYCRMPTPGVAHVSASKDEKTHGQKLYSLFARDRNDYFGLTPKKSAVVGQAIVKQSWVPEEVKTDGPLPDRLRPESIPFKEILIERDTKEKQPALFTGDHFWPYARKGDKLFKASRQADLFIMMKLEPKTPGTDGGWVYGTVTADGKTVTSAGRVESCMKCHEDAKNERLFGVQR
jgi:hypothetical protein